MVINGYMGVPENGGKPRKTQSGFADHEIPMKNG